MTALDGFSLSSFTHEGVTRDVYRAGSGPGVIVIHEMPGLTPKVAEFGARVAGAGFTAVLPSLFGEPGRPPTTGYLLRELVRGCVAREFTSWARQRTSPITVWCRALAKSSHAELGGKGVGAIGMCFTGGFALAMMIDDHTVAPVLSQPSVPFAIGRRRAESIDLSPADRERVRARAMAGCEVLGLRYKSDKAVPPTRFQALHELLGDRFIAVEFEGNGHSVLTEHVQEEGVARVLAFLEERLR